MTAAASAQAGGGFGKLVVWGVVALAALVMLSGLPAVESVERSAPAEWAPIPQQGGEDELDWAHGEGVATQPVPQGAPRSIDVPWWPLPPIRVEDGHAFDKHKIDCEMILSWFERPDVCVEEYANGTRNRKLYRLRVPELPGLEGVVIVRYSGVLRTMMLMPSERVERTLDRWGYDRSSVRRLDNCTGPSGLAPA